MLAIHGAVGAPTGGQVVTGSGTISQSGNTTTISQSSNDLSLNWQSFNIGANEVVNFVQPGSTAIAINRILSNSATNIFGHLDANGQVWLINPNGILFGKGAEVNVGGLTASTLDLEDSSLDSTERKFAGSGKGSVINEGKITAANGGYVALLANHVSNQGVIGARLGTVALGAGSAETLTFNGQQLIHLRVDKSTLNNLADNQQLIQANGGQVFMTAGAHDALLASVVNNTGIIQAHAVESHDGTIVLSAGMQTGTVEVGGTLDAGAPAGGRGGFIETSAATLDIAKGAKITAGIGGTWLVDPTDLTIDATAATTIENTLNSGTSVTEQTTATTASGIGNQSAGAGDINVDAPITWTSAAATLTLTAYNAVNVNASVHGAGAVSMQAVNGNLTIASGASVDGDAGVTLGTGGSFINQAGAAAVSAGSSGRWMIYSSDPTLDSPGGLTPGFIQYGASFQAAPAQGSGNGFLYSIAPTITVTGLGGTVQKTYDGTTTAALSSANFTASGLVNGDQVVAMNGSYQGADVGTGLGVTSAATATDLTVVSASGNVPVYGYALGGTSVTAAIGTISPAPLSGAIIGNPTKVYDGTATATLTSANYGLTGFVSGQSATVNQPSSVTYASPDAGSQTVSATFSATNFVAGSGTKLSNYTLPMTATGTGTVLQAPLVIGGVLATDKVYDGTTADTLNTSQASIYGVIGSDSVALSSSGATGTFVSPNAGNKIEVTTSGFTLTGAAEANYQLIQPSGLAANITPATLTVTGVQATNKVYDGTVADSLNVANAAVSGLIAGDTSAVVFSSAAAAGSFVTKNVGNALEVNASGFSISGASAGNYTLVQPSGLAADITPAPLTIALTGNPTKPYNGTTTAEVSAANFTISGFVGGEGASIPQTSSTQYASANAGTQTVTAIVSLPDIATTGSTLLSNYSVPTTVVGTGTITPAPLTGSIVGNPTKVYDGTTSAALSGSNYTLSGFLPGQGASINQTVGTYASANAGLEIVSASLSGTNYVAASGTLLSNYSLPTTLSGTGTITPAQLGGYVQAGIVGDPTKMYDGTTTATLNSANFVLTGFIAGQGATVTQTVGQYASANAGSQTVTANLSSGDFSANSGTVLANYHLPTVAYGSGTITAAPLTVSIVNDPTRVYNGTTNLSLDASDYSISGFVSGQGALINPSALINYASANVGAENITAVLTPSAYTANSGTLMSNYILATSASGAGHITPAPLYVTGVYATNKVYDTTAVDPLSTGAVALAGVVSSDVGDVTLQGNPTGSFATIHVGNALPVTVTGYSISGSASSNYSLQPTTNLVANITPAPLTVTGVTANSKSYDATTTATINTASGGLSGVLGSDGVSLSSSAAQANFNSANAGSGLKVTATGFTIAGPEASDYSLSQPSGLTADITPAPITALITGNPTKVYDGSASTTLVASNYTLLGFAPGQGASVPQSASASYAAPDAGTNIPINSSLVLSDFVAAGGTNLANYQLPSTGSGTGTITQAPLVATLVGNPTKSYDSTTGTTLAASNFALSGFVGGQSATITQTAGTYAAANAGVEPVTASLTSGDYAAGSGTNLNNYALPASASGSGTITRAPLTVSGISTTPQVYNGTTTDMLTGGTLTGTVFGTDAPTLVNAATGTLGSAGNVGTDSVTTNIGVTGAGSANYIVTQPSNLTAVISPAALNATSNVTKPYDGTTVANLSGGNTTITGFVAGQGATVNGGVTGTFASQNVGSGLAVTGNALSASDLTANAGTLLSNYAFPASDNGTGTITPATLTYTATPSSQMYGTTPVGLTGSLSGFVNNETALTATTGIEAFTTTATSTSNVGRYAINGSGLTANNGNYVFVQAPGNATALDITPAPLSVINVATTSRAYDGTTVDALSGATLVGAYYNGDAPVLTNYSAGTLSNSGNVGTDAVTTNMGLSGPGSGNYALTQPSGLTALITAAPLTATSSVSRAYTGTVVADLSGANTVLTGFVPGQGATVNSGVTGTFASANVGSGIEITGGSLSASNLTANASTLLSNYALPASDNGTGSITPAVVNLSGARVYDGATDAAAVIFGTSGTVAGVDGQNLTLSGSTLLPNKNVGTQTLTSMGSLTLNDGTGSASNYTLIGGSDTVSVSKLGITVTATAGNREYNGTTTATGIALVSTGVLSGDTLSFTDTSALFDTKNVGTGKTVTVSGIAATGSGSGNYSLNATTTTTADITPAIIDLSGSRTYDAGVDANATIFGTGGSITTGIGSETLSLTGSGTLAGKNAGAETLSSLGTLTLGNGTGVASNYTLSGGMDTANITKLVITASGTASDKVYDGTTAATVLALGSAGVLAGDTVSFADSSAAFSDKNVGNGKTVTISGITDGGADASNYTLSSSSATTAANITPLGITVTATAGNKTYDGTTAAGGIVLVGSGVLSGDTLTYHDSSATFDTQNAGVGKTVTISGITATGTDASDYSFNTSTTATANITPAVLDLAGTRAYDGGVGAQASVFGANGTLNTGIGSETVALSGTGSLASKNAGSESVASLGTLSLGNGSGLAANYTLIGGTDSVSVTKLGISVTGTAADKVYDGTVGATVTSLASSGVLAGDTVLFSDAGAAFNNKNAGAGKTVTISGISETGADAGNYMLNSSTATTTAGITPLGITVIGSAANKIYDGSANATVTALGSAGIIAGDTVSFADTSAAFDNKNVGTGKSVTISGITEAGADAGNYTLNSTAAIVQANITPLAITVTGTGSNKVYDGAVNDTVSLTSAGVIAGDNVVFADNAATFSNKNVGTAKPVSIVGITASGTDAGNYTLSNTTAATAADITPLGITLAATAADKVYDGNTAATVTALSGIGIIAGDTVTLADTAANFSDKNAGTNKTVIVTGLTEGGADAGNYTVLNNIATTTAAISPLAITVTAAGTNRTYDGTLNDAVTLASTGILPGDTVTFADASALFANKNVGTAKTVAVTGITAGGSDGANYTVNASTTTVADVTPLSIVVSALGANKVYDGSVTDAVALTSAGVVAGDAITFTDATAIFGDKNVGTGKSVAIAGISASGADAQDYALINTTASTVADITPRPITVSAVGTNKVYDGSVSDQVTLSAANVVGGDSLTFSDAAANFTNKIAGVGKAVSVSGIALGGADADNYTANATASTTATIMPLAITVSATGTSKTYDGTTADTVILNSNGVLAGDTVTFSDAAANFNSKNVGSNKPVSVTGIVADGPDAQNYTVASAASTMANINPAVLTETATPVSSLIGQNPELSGSLSGFVAGDTSANSTTGKLVWTAVLPAHPSAGQYPIDGSGLSAQNYQIVQSPGNSSALTLSAISVEQQDAAQQIFGMLGLPIAPDYIATPYGVGSNDERSNNTGNARRDWNLTTSNRRLSDFSGRTGLSVVGAGVKLPDESP